MGPFDNETGKYIETPGFGQGSHWYVDDRDQLYIVPDAEAEIEGPDTETLQALNKVYREATSFLAVNPEGVAEKLGLEVIPDVLKRFDPDTGYYRA